MSGSSYTITCPKCKAENTLRGKAMTLAATCTACQTYFRVGHWEKKLTSFSGRYAPAIAIGSKGKIENITYEVMGFVVKKEVKYKYLWREYLLFNPFMGYAFLSEYDGHWNIIWPIDEDPKGSGIGNDFYNKGDQFQLYQKYSAEVIYAEGEFFFDVVSLTESTLNIEYISPPRMLALEQSDDSVLWCEGEYITPNDVAAAFSLPIEKLPKKTGISYTQPLVTSFKEESLIKFSIILIFVLIGLQLFLSASADEKVVFQGDFFQTDLKDQKFMVTPSFTLEGASKSLVISIYAPIRNDWFFAEFSLINEDNGTEYNFSKDLEFYSGYEDGYNWTEGSTKAEAFLSQIPEGRYHINIYPEFSSSSHEFSLVIKRDVSNFSNFIIVFLLLALFPVGFYIRKHYFERKRWSESDYSPFEY